MNDPRYTKLADVLTQHSTSLAAGEHLLVETWDIPEDMIIALVESGRRAGAHVHVVANNSRIQRAQLMSIEDEALESMAAIDRHRMEKMDAYIGLRGSDNASELSDVPEDRMKARGRLYMKPVHFEQRVKHTKWCVLRWPNAGMAQLAQMSTSAFRDFYFNVCTVDYGKMQGAADALAARMNRTDRVRLLGPTANLGELPGGVGAAVVKADGAVVEGTVLGALADRVGLLKDAGHVLDIVPVTQVLDKKIIRSIKMFFMVETGYKIVICPRGR